MMVKNHLGTTESKKGQRDSLQQDFSGSFACQIHGLSGLKHPWGGSRELQRAEEQAPKSWFYFPPDVSMGKGLSFPIYKMR